MIVGTYEIEQNRACSREDAVLGRYSLYDAKLACSFTDWCEMFYQKGDGFYFCSYGGTYYDPYATLYRKPSKQNPNICFFIVNYYWLILVTCVMLLSIMFLIGFGFRDDSESTRSQDIANKPPPKIGRKSAAPPLKIQLKKFVTKRFSPMA